MAGFLQRSLVHARASAPEASGHQVRAAVGVVIFLSLLHLSATAAHAGNYTGLQVQRASAFEPWAGTPPITVAAVGDGAGGNPHDTKVSDLIISRQADMLLYLGDVYDQGAPEQYTDYYEPTYGRLRAITNPVPGNHDYKTANAAGYFGYWDDIPQFYSYDSGGWHFIALDSAGSKANLKPGSAQYEWLANDLDANSLPCTLAYYHHPRYSIGQHGDNTMLADVWSLLAQKGVDVTLAGHDHDYQRWQPLDGDGIPTGGAAGGVTAFIVGTGGGGVREIPGSDARVAAQAVSYGALFLDLAADRADFRFVNPAGEVLDSGTVECSAAAEPAQPPDAAQTNAPMPAPVTPPQTAANTLAATAQGRELTFAPVADAYVAADKPGANYGESPVLRVDGEPSVLTYLRFDVEGLAGPVTKATLRLWANGASASRYQVQGVSDNGWTETGIIFDNAPLPTGDVILSGSVVQDSWVETDVKALVQANGPLSLVVSGHGPTAASASSRTGDHPPQLVVETGGAGGVGPALVLDK